MRPRTEEPIAIPSPADRRRWVLACTIGPAPAAGWIMPDGSDWADPCAQRVALPGSTADGEWPELADRALAALGWRRTAAWPDGPHRRVAVRRFGPHRVPPADWLHAHFPAQLFDDDRALHSLLAELRGTGDHERQEWLDAWARDRSPARHGWWWSCDAADLEATAAGFLSHPAPRLSIR